LSSVAEAAESNSRAPLIMSHDAAVEQLKEAGNDEFTCTVQNEGIGPEEQPVFRKVFSSGQGGSVPASWPEAPADLNLPNSVNFSVEVREYAPMVVATTPYLEEDGAKPGWFSWPGSWSSAPQKRMQTACFFRLAGYIGVFSQIPVVGRFAPPKNNAVASAADPETVPIAMTSPVMMTPTPSPIAMTAPVMMAPSTGRESSLAAMGNQAQMSFVLPRSLFKSAAAAPVPTDSNVTIHDKPGKFVAVLQLHGPRADVPEKLVSGVGEEGDESKYMQALVSKLAELSEFHSMFKSTGAHEVLGYMDPMASMQIRELHLELELAVKL